MGEVLPYTLEMYGTLQGHVPFTAWLDALRDVQARARILVRLNRLRRGNPGDAQSVGAGVWELRIDYGPGYRVYYAQSARQTFLILAGGDKTTQQADIRRARQYWHDYQHRRSS
jgi:putative addiction module killer protein